jgi:hypothetical protein
MALRRRAAPCKRLQAGSGLRKVAAPYKPRPVPPSYMTFAERLGFTWAEWLMIHEHKLSETEIEATIDRAIERRRKRLAAAWVKKTTR